MRKLLWTLLAAACMAWAAPAAAQQQGRWLRAESDGFVVYGATSEPRLRGVAEELESLDGLLRRMTGAPAERSPHKLEVYLLSDQGFHETFPNLRDDIVGLYTAQVDLTGAFATYSEVSGLGSRDTLFHEYAHHFMFQYFANAYPAWYVEGFAELIATVTLGSERIVIGRSNEGRFYTLRNENWMPMQQLLTARPLELSSEDAQKFYAQSWLFAHHILLTPGRQEQFLAYIRALRTGAEPAAAFQTGFGMTPEDMQSELRRYLRSSPNAIALTRPAAAQHGPIQITRMSPGADVLLPLSARIRVSMVREGDRDGVLQRVRQLAAATPDDRFAATTLAYAEAEFGDTAAARELMQRQLAASPEDIEALTILGSTYLRDAEDQAGSARIDTLAQARRQFAHAYRNDPNYVPAMYRYAMSYSGVMMNETTAANYLNILLLAHQLAPQIDTITLNAASALMMRDRNREAIPLLRAVAYDPHGGPGADAAQQMLQRAESAAGSAAQ